MMKAMLGRTLAVTALAFALVAPALAQDKGKSASKGGEYKGSYGDDVHTVPEPGTLALLGLGVAGVVLIARRRRK